MRNFVLLGMFWQLFSSSVLALDLAVGSIKTYRPEAAILRNGVESNANLGAKVYSGDFIKTGTNASLGIMFLDGSVLSLGPETEFEIERFHFEPAVENVSLLTRIQRGTLSFLSGAIGRISPESVKFRTPTATLGLRGTKVLIKVE